MDRTQPNGETTPPVSFWTKLRHGMFGSRKNPFDPQVFQHISLIAFFAWVGMGADGISSANYGPEEAYHALRGFTFLSPIIGIASAAVILLISISYVQIIEQFPSGGGGYVVASKLLHPRLGVISGASLLIDYALTIAVSIVAGVDAVISLLPGHWLAWKLIFSLIAVLILLVMNLRGIRESVLALTPLFLMFIVTHVGLSCYGFFSHIDIVPERISEASSQFGGAIDSVGVFALIGIFLQAFSKGAGTFTGIEAVSNGLLALREPRALTGKKTMIYMAVSLAILSTMLYISYFLFNLEPQAGRTLNAVLFESITGSLNVTGLPLGTILMWVTLISAALILFVAAQTGFIDGPRVLANMALDSWLPHRLSHLSERLVAQNGILLMGLAAIFFMVWAQGNTSALIALYAINVFITFSLSQLGMSKLWLSRRKEDSKWLRHLIINGTGFVVCFTLLVIMVVFKFTSGGWLTVVITTALVLLCFYIRRHYRMIKGKIRELDDILGGLPLGDSVVKHESLKPTEPTAVILVQDYGGQGVHVMLNAQRLFGSRFKQYIFLSVGSIDSGAFKGVDEMAELRKKVQKEADKYVTLARSYGLLAESRTSCEIDYITEIERLCLKVHEEFPNSVFFAARLLFWKDTIWTRILHNETPLTLQRRLMFHGLQFIVLPVRLQ